MKNFQTSHGLNPSGKLDAPTLQKLGLGSQTAGVARADHSAKFHLEAGFLESHSLPRKSSCLPVRSYCFPLHN